MINPRDFLSAVGNTPLIRLRQASELTGCEIFGKCEFMNPGGSVKDRAAKYMLLDAMDRGRIEPGGIVVEGTAGNTGIGLTLAGVSLWMQDRKPGTVIAAADPDGAGVYSWVKHGTMQSAGSSITEGIGQNRVTGNLDGARIDEAFNIPDAELVPVLWDLIGKEGLYVGASSAINVAGAIRLGQSLGPGRTIVTILCDSASRYASRLFDRDFLRSKGLPPPPWLSAP